ncbi:hypothetical protein ROBYS_43120 [Roseobacter sp. OBYS 0001]|nr:hypothetical protein ROBYS_43120 [Roseobacter sp. OBYS 0001]
MWVSLSNSAENLLLDFGDMAVVHAEDESVDPPKAAGTAKESIGNVVTSLGPDMR